MPNHTKYTCPFLMSVALWIYRFKLRRTHNVYWKKDSDGIWYIVYRQRGKEGGFQLSCPFPRWMILTEHRIRSFFSRNYGNLVLSKFIH